MMAFQVIWDPLLIGPFLWLAGLAGMGSVAYVLLRQAKVDNLKAFSWVLFISIVAALVFVVADLSRPWNVVNAVTTSFFTGEFGLFRSWMAVGIVLISVATVLLFLVVLRHTTNIKMLNAVVDAGWFGVLLAAVGVLVTIYSGFLIAAAPGIPFWNTALIPVLWILSASVCALALTELMIHRDDITRFIVRTGSGLKVAELIAVLALVNLAIYGGTTAAKISGWALAYGPLAPAFWGGVVAVGMLIPLAIGLISWRRENKLLLATAAILALIGALILRIVVIQAGVFEPVV
ncbi:MAG: NrfD/PsrC family molybdoenzyme membrane anchor subunit [Pyrobaculum sp.]